MSATTLGSESSGGQQRTHVRRSFFSPLDLSVRSGQHDDSLRRSHSVHLDQQLIERVLALVVAAAGAAVLAASATNGVDLILT